MAPPSLSEEMKGSQLFPFTIPHWNYMFYGKVSPSLTNPLLVTLGKMHLFAGDLQTRVDITPCLTATLNMYLIFRCNEPL